MLTQETIEGLLNIIKTAVANGQLAVLEVENKFTFQKEAMLAVVDSQNQTVLPIAILKSMQQVINEYNVITEDRGNGASVYETLISVSGVLQNALNQISALMTDAKKQAENTIIAENEENKYDD